MIDEKKLGKKAMCYADGVIRTLTAGGPRVVKFSEIRRLVEAAYFNGFQSGVVWQKGQAVALNKEDRTALVRSLTRAIEHTPERERKAHKAVYDKLSEFIVMHTPRKTLRAVGRAVDRAMGR